MAKKRRTGLGTAIAVGVLSAAGAYASGAPADSAGYSPSYNDLLRWAKGDTVVAELVNYFTYSPNGRREMSDTSRVSWAMERLSEARRNGARISELIDAMDSCEDSSGVNEIIEKHIAERK